MRAAAHILAAPPQITRDRHLISPVDYLLYTPLLPDVAGGVVDPRFNTIPLSDNLTGVRLICGYVERSISPARTVCFRDQENATQELA